MQYFPAISVLARRSRPLRSMLAVCALFLALTLPAPLPAQSVLTCTGSEACDYLPTATLRRMLDELQSQYTNTLFDDMAESSVLANLMGPPIGTVNLHGFAIGTNFGAAVVVPHDVTVNIPGQAEFEKIPSAGGAISPRIYIGANLGQIMGGEYDPFSAKKKPSYISPNRFDVYLSAMDYTETQPANGETGGKIRGSVWLRGVELRYHAVEGRNLAGGPMLRFLGVSIGAGAYTTRQTIRYEANKQQLDFKAEGQEFGWKGTSIVSWDTKVDTYPVDVRTGIQLLYIMNLTIGAGVASSKGSSDFLLQRTGEVFVKSDLAQSAGYELPTAVLALQIKGNGDVPARLTYGRLGVELNLWAVKLSLDALVTKRSYGANLGLRVEL